MTEPEQWAVELARTLSRDCNCRTCVTHDALTIQRAFEERERELREAAAVMPFNTMSTVTMLQPCPPHTWVHAPTVGYFHCHKCNQRIEHNDPRYAAMLAEWGTAIALKALATRQDAPVSENSHEEQ